MLMTLMLRMLMTWLEEAKFTILFIVQFHCFDLSISCLKMPLGKF